MQAGLKETYRYRFHRFSYSVSMLSLLLLSQLKNGLKCIALRGWSYRIHFTLARYLNCFEYSHSV